MQIAPGFYSMSQNEGGHVHAYLVDDVLIDTLYDDDAGVILAELKALGKTPRDIKHIVLTHGHKSHISGLAAIQRMSGATVYAHEWEAPIIEGKRKAERVGLPRLTQRPRNFTVWKLQTALHFGLGSHQPCKVNRYVKDGDKVGPLEVIETPGHTPGSLSFWHPELDVIVVADTICTYPELGAWEGFTQNQKDWERSIAKLAAISRARILCSGHGAPLLDGAADVIKGLRK